MDATTFKAKLAERKRRKAALACLVELAKLLKCDANPEAVLQAVETLHDAPKITPEAAFDLIIDTVAAKLEGIDGAEKILASLIAAKAVLKLEPAEITRAAGKMERVLAETEAGLLARGFLKCSECGQMNKPDAELCRECKASLKRKEDLDIPPYMRQVVPTASTPAPTAVPIAPPTPPPPPALPRIPPPPLPPRPIPVVPTAPTTGWKCMSCGGEGNEGKFCAKCGVPKPDGSVPSPRIVFGEVTVEGVTLTVTSSINVHGEAGRCSAVVHTSDGRTGLPEGYEIIWYASQNLSLVEDGKDHSRASFTAARGAKAGTAKITAQVVKIEGSAETPVAQDEKIVQLTNGLPELVFDEDTRTPGAPVRTIRPANGTHKRTGTLA